MTPTTTNTRTKHLKQYDVTYTQNKLFCSFKNQETFNFVFIIHKNDFSKKCSASVINNSRKFVERVSSNQS